MTPENTSDLVAVEMINRMKYPIDEIWHDPAAKAIQSVAASDTRMVLRKIKCRNPRGRDVADYTTWVRVHAAPG